MSAPTATRNPAPAAADATAAPAPGAPHTPWGRAVGLAVAAVAIVVAVLLAFLWPTVTSAVKDLPVAVAGPPTAVSAVEKQLDTAAEGAFEATAVSTRAEAVDLIRTRQVYGAIVLGDEPEVLTASANGAAVGQLFGQLAQRLQAQAQQQADATVKQAVAAGRAPAGAT